MTARATATGEDEEIEGGGGPLQLALGTGAFVVCFALFGSISAMVPLMRERFALSSLEVGVVVALPVLVGSLGRIPLGAATDRFGGRRVFLVVLIASMVPALLLGFAETFASVAVLGVFAGVALASFSVGVPFVSRWYPPERRGTALGIYGAGNIGQALAAAMAPALAISFGYAWGFHAFVIIAGAWLVVFAWLARDAPGARRRAPLRESFRPLAERASWVLSAFYFVTFGGFVAMSVYLPTFLTEVFSLEVRDAGLRTAGFVAVATFARPVGGWLSDRVGARRILLAVFPSTAVFALLLAWSDIVTFTIGALGMALAIGLGNGAVFALVPQRFPRTVGAVTGLVGAAGGLGGFFPPLALGLIRELTGTYVLGFALLSTAAVCCAVLAWRLEKRPAP